MAKSDFAFTFYDGDAARDMAHMNRLERGAYMDVLVQQRQRGHLSKDDLKKFLSKDFDLVWGALEWVLKKDVAGKFYIEWLEASEKRAKTHSKLQKDRRTGKTKQQPNQQSGQPDGDLKGDGDGNGIGDEGVFKNYKEWTDQILDRNDNQFQVFMMNERIPDSDNLDFWIRDHLGLLERYPKMRPEGQHRFVGSCIKHVRENYKKPINGTGSKNGQHGVNASIKDFAERASAKPVGS